MTRRARAHAARGLSPGVHSLTRCCVWLGWQGSLAQKDAMKKAAAEKKAMQDKLAGKKK